MRLRLANECFFVIPIRYYELVGFQMFFIDEIHLNDFNYIIHNMAKIIKKRIFSYYID